MIVCRSVMCLTCGGNVAECTQTAHGCSGALLPFQSYDGIYRLTAWKFTEAITIVTHLVVAIVTVCLAAGDRF